MFKWGLAGQVEVGWGKRWDRKRGTVWHSQPRAVCLTHSQPHTAPLMSLDQLGFLLVAEEEDCGVVYEEGARQCLQGSPAH